MHKVLADTLINLPHRYSLKFDRNYFNGLYPAQFYNAEHKIVLTLVSCKQHALMPGAGIRHILNGTRIHRTK